MYDACLYGVPPVSKLLESIQSMFSKGIDVYSMYMGLGSMFRDEIDV